MIDSMKSLTILILFVPSFFLQPWNFLSAQEVKHAIEFNRDIRRLLADRCFVCHGPDEAANDSGVRLDNEADALDAEVWVPGDPEQSTLVERIESDDEDEMMPPADSGLKLTPDEIKLLREWIKQGAKYEKHWAFQPLPKAIEIPKIANAKPETDWCRNPIDHFIFARLEQEKLAPSEEAERWRWLRRVTFDLTGLPPSIKSIRAFENDASPNACETVVDRLLDSPEFGRHFATSWLDMARYADSFGYQSDQLSPTWPYRDWVVRALNSNLPYDQFLSWQIAGDLLPDATSDQKTATAFNRLHRQTNEGGSVVLEWQTEYVADRVNTFGTAMLGMTIECARCHDHKFDPVSHQDYYNLAAFFNSIDEWGMYHDSSRVPTPTLLLPNAKQKNRILEIENELQKVQQQLADSKNAIEAETLSQWLGTVKVLAVPKPVVHWTLDEFAADSTLPAQSIPASNESNQAGESPTSKLAAKSSTANKIVQGRHGHALKLTGDDPVNFPAPGSLKIWERYSISLWMKIPADLGDAVILHRQGGTDVGFFGTELSLRDGKLLFAASRFWPGNAVAIETAKAVARDQWIHIVVSNQGTGDASGMTIRVNPTIKPGRSAKGVAATETRVVRDRLTKAPKAGGSGFVAGERFRSTGFKNGLIDDIRFYDRPLSLAEAELAGDPAAKALKFGDLPREIALEQFLVSSESHQNLVKKRSAAVKALLEFRLGVVETMVMEEMPENRSAYVLARGEYDAPRSEKNIARRETLSGLPPMSDDLPRNRLGLAMWLVSDDHPLTARVAVNRFWQSFFGSGLVGTPEDFGLQGQTPSHPELLDWLARDFVSGGWDVKRLCKQITLCSTYRQSSRCSETLRQRDPKNLLLARGPSGRLSAEMIRDLALKASGLLKEKRSGPPVSPYQPPNLWRENNTMTPAYKQSVAAGLYHRSLYSVWKRTSPLPNMLNFDATSREVCTVRRTTTNTPLQALVLLNDVQFVEAARALADRVRAKSNETGDRIDTMFILLTGRAASDEERKLLTELYTEQKQIFTNAPGEAEKFLSVGQSPASRKKTESVNKPELAALTVVAQAVLNCDASIWKR